MGDRNTLQNLVAVVVTIRFGGLLRGELEALHGHKGYGWVCPWMTVGVVRCQYGRICLGQRWMLSFEEAPGSQRELVLSFVPKLPWVGGSVGVSIIETYTASLVS